MEQRYRKVRKQLDGLGYIHPLFPEAVPLVDKLVGDLIQTTESLKKYTKIAKEVLDERDNLLIGAEPYKCDNAKLVKECNDLNLALLHCRERSEKIQKDLKHRINVLERDKFNCDIECEKLKKSIRELQLESAKKTGRILTLEDKNLRPGLKSSSTTALLRKSSLKSKSNFQVDSTMALADQKIANLTKEIKKLKDEQLKLTELNGSYQNQLNNRDKEIERLGGMLEGGRPPQAINKDCCFRDMDGKVSRMQDQISGLHREKLDLEDQLKESISKQHEAMKRALNLAERNKQLEKEMRDIDQMALAVEAECNSTVKDKTEKLNRIQQSMHDSVAEIQALEREVAELKREKQEMLSDMDALRLEKKHLQTMLTTVLDEKKRLTDRINQFTVIEHDLNAEIDRLVQASAVHKRKIAELDCKVLAGRYDAASDLSLISEEFTKRGKKGGKSDRSPKRQKSRSPSPKSSKNKSPSPPRSPKKSKIKKNKSPKRGGSPRRGSYAPANTPETELSARRSKDYDGDNSGHVCTCTKALRRSSDKDAEHISCTVEHFRAERDHYLKEYHKLLEQMQNMCCPPANNNEFAQKLEDRDQSIASLQHENRTLSQEKHNLMARLETMRDRSDMDIDGMSLKSTVRRLERDRDLLKGDIVRLEEERDAIRQRLKIATENQVSEHDRMEKALLNAEEQLRRMEQERRELMHTQGSRRATISGLEEQCETLRDQLRTTQTELNHLRALYGQLKVLHEQTDKALSDSQGQLIQVEKELANAQERTRNLEKDRSQLDQEVVGLKNDVLVLRGNLAEIDQEKDGLLISLDDKTERIALLEQELRQKDNATLSLEKSLAEVRKKVSLSIDDSVSRDHLLRTATSETSNLKQQLEAALRARDNLMQENRRIQDDLASCAADCRTTHNDLEITRRHVEDLKHQLQHYVAEIKRFEDLMSQKEMERSELLDQFRSLSHEAVVLESSNHTLENEATQSKVQLSVTLDHVGDLERKMETSDTMLRGYEKQISELTSQLAGLEMQLTQCRTQGQHTESDLASLRDLCVKLDQQKDELLRELAEKENNKTQVNRDLERLRSQSNTLQATLAKDRGTVENLEQLLAESRQESVEQRLLNQELQAQVTRLQEQIEELRRRLTSTSEQVDLYQEKALEYSQQNKQLRREIANERFFKARDDHKPSQSTTSDRPRFTFDFVKTSTRPANQSLPRDELIPCITRPRSADLQSVLNIEAMEMQPRKTTKETLPTIRESPEHLLSNRLRTSNASQDIRRNTVTSQTQAQNNIRNDESMGYGVTTKEKFERTSYNNRRNSFQQQGGSTFPQSQQDLDGKNGSGEEFGQRTGSKQQDIAATSSDPVLQQPCPCYTYCPYMEGRKLNYSSEPASSVPNDCRAPGEDKFVCTFSTTEATIASYTAKYSFVNNDNVDSTRSTNTRMSLRQDE